MHNYNELNYFITIAEAKSFIGAAKSLGVSSSALSHSMRNLETRLNLRLFNRTTRSLSLTEAGEQLYKQLAPLFKQINEEVNALGDYLDTPSGTIRINASNIAIENFIYPKLSQFSLRYPQIKIEIECDNNLVDIVKDGFDMGCRIGNDLTKEMVAVKISDPLRMVLVASPDYLKQRKEPKQISDLDQHLLIGKKVSSQHGMETIWEFTNSGNIIQYHPSSHFSINNHLRKQAILDGLGICWIGYPDVKNELATGRLIELLSDYSITYEPFYIYYPSRKGHSNVFKLVLEALKS